MTSKHWLFLFHSELLLIFNAIYSLGRSSGAGSLSIWTHKLKGIQFTNTFIAEGCESGASAIPAVTLGAAEQWLGEALYSHSNQRGH